jgi:hypothetical protein
LRTFATGRRRQPLLLDLQDGDLVDEFAHETSMVGMARADGGSGELKNALPVKSLKVVRS